jgi:LysM repeat protein
MKRTAKYLTRLLALLAIAAVVVAVVLIVSSFKNESNDDKGNRNVNGNGKANPTKKHKTPQRSKAKTYTVESGDTLTAIAHKTGVPVAELQALNPEIDPQILIAGEVLKLR